MSDFVVIKYFTDLQDGGHAYNVGDKFPRDGVSVSNARLKELSSADNKQHQPLIEKVVNKTNDVVGETNEPTLEDFTTGETDKVDEVKPKSKSKKKGSKK